MSAITSRTFEHGPFFRPAFHVPRGARVAARLFGDFLHLMGHLFTVAPPAKRGRAEEAAEVREMARRVQRTDPGFAADLYAAAARHEGEASR